MHFTFLAQADQATLQLELARRALEKARADLETAKQAYDEMLKAADEQGVNRAKLKKLSDERVQALIESGMLEDELGPKKEKTDKPKRPSKKQKATLSEAEASFSSEAEAADLTEVGEPEIPPRPEA